MESRSTGLKSTVRRLRWIAISGLLLSSLIGVVAVGIDYGLRVAGLWSTYGGGRARWWHFRCVELVDVAEFGALVFFFLTIAVALEAAGRWRRWLSLGWLSVPIAAALVAVVFHSDILGWFRVWEPIYSPAEPASWFVHQLTRVSLEWALWLALAGGLIFLHWLALTSLWIVRRVRGTTDDETASRPLPVTSRALLLTVVALTAMTGSTLGATAIAIGGLTDTAATAAVGCGTALFTALLVVGCTTMSSTTGKATVACLFGAIAVALLNTPFSFIVAWSFGSEFRQWDEPLFGLASLSAVFGAAAAVPLGFVFGLLYLVPVRIAHRLSRSLAHEALDKVFHIVGTWSFCIGALCLVAGHSLVRYEHFGLPVSIVPQVLAAVVMAMGFIAATIGFIRLKRRRQWLSQVRNGRVDGWALVPLCDLKKFVKGLRPVLDVTGTVDAVLARKLPGHPSGAYRTGDIVVPEALIVTTALR